MTTKTSFNLFDLEIRIFELRWPQYVNHLERRARLKKRALSYSEWEKNTVVDDMDMYELTGNWIVRAKLERDVLLWDGDDWLRLKEQAYPNSITGTILKNFSK